jgi:hypothetical protein
VPVHGAHAIAALDQEGPLRAAQAPALSARHAPHACEVRGRKVELGTAAADRKAREGEQVDPRLGQRSESARGLTGPTRHLARAVADLANAIRHR